MLGVQTSEPLAKSPVRQRGDDSVAGYLQVVAAIGNPPCGSLGIDSNPAFEEQRVSFSKIETVPKAGSEKSLRCRIGDFQTNLHL